MKSNKTQSSFEMLLVFGFSFLLVILGSGYYIIFSNNATQSIDLSQRDKIFNDVMDKSTRIFYQGNGNRITINAQLPSGVSGISIMSGVNDTGFEFNYLNVTYLSAETEFTSLYFPNELFVRLNCSSSCFYDGSNWVFEEEFYTQGPKEIRIESKGDYVLIDFVRFEG